MIRRDILDENFNVKKFDFFNDCKDTCSWLMLYIYGERVSRGDRNPNNGIELKPSQESLVRLRNLALQYKREKDEKNS